MQNVLKKPYQVQSMARTEYSLIKLNDTREGDISEIFSDRDHTTQNNTEIT